MSTRTTGGTLAAWLIIAAILGFAGGAFFGLQSGGAEEPRAESTTPADSTDDGGDSGDPSDDETSDEPTASDTPTSGEVTADLKLSPKKVKAGEAGRIDLRAKIEPAREGVVLELQRSIGGGEWDRFGDSLLTTDADGEVTWNFWTGQAGDNAFRLVDNETGDAVSNEVTVQVTE